MSQSRYLSISALSIVTGLDRTTIRTRLADVTPYSKTKNMVMFDAQVVIPMLFRPESSTAIAKQLEQEQLRYEKARADKMELEVAKRKGQLVEVTEISKIVEKEYVAVKASLMAIPNKLATVFPDRTQAAFIKDESEQLINETLQELSADKEFEIEDVGLSEDSATSPQQDSQAATED